MRNTTRWGRWVVAAAGVATLLPAVAQPPKIEVYPERGACIEPGDKMRRIHHRLLHEQKNLSVHEGIRNARVQMNQCIACHASPQTLSVASHPNDFCVACHQYTAVKIDCFTCHQPQVEKTAMPRRKE